MKSKMAFVAVGGINTLFSTGCFYLLDALVNPNGRNPVMADVALILSLFAATPFAYFMQRHLVFRPDAPAGMREFLRFASVAVGTYAINIFSLPILVLALNHTHSGHYEISGMRFSNALVAQLFISAGVACISWFSHSRFSFKGPQPSH